MPTTLKRSMGLSLAPCSAEVSHCSLTLLFMSSGSSSCCGRCTTAWQASRPLHHLLQRHEHSQLLQQVHHSRNRIRNGQEMAYRLTAAIAHRRQGRECFMTFPLPDWKKKQHACRLWLGSGLLIPCGLASWSAERLCLLGNVQGSRPSVCIISNIPSTPERSNTTCNRHNNRLKPACTYVTSQQP